MHIASAQIENIFRLHLHKVYAPTVKPGIPVGRSDQVTLSRQATEIQAVRQHISSLPEVRQDRLSEIRHSVETGAYQVCDQEIAAAMVAGMGRGGA